MDVLGLRLWRSFDDRLLAEADRLVRAQWWAAARAPERNRAALAASNLFGLTDDQGELQAFARVLHDGSLKALVLDVVVAPAARGRGLGRAFLTAILESPEMGGIDHIELYCEPALVPYYEELGFSRRAGGAVFMRRENRPSPPIPDQEKKS